MLVSHDFPGDYICECERLRCDEPRVPIPPDEFTVVLFIPETDVVAPGHQPQYAEVLWQGDGYLVIREQNPKPANPRTGTPKNLVIRSGSAASEQALTRASSLVASLSL